MSKAFINLSSAYANLDKENITSALENRRAREAANAAREAALNAEAEEELRKNQACMNSHRNAMGNLQMPFTAKDEHIYMYNGHGGTVCDDKGKPVIKQVPDNCIYITQTVCGIVNELDTKIFKAFADKSYAHIWRNPIRYIKELQALFEHEPTVHIHFPRCSYVDTEFFPLSDTPPFEKAPPNTYQFQLSGLIPLAKALTIPDDDRFLLGEVLTLPNRKLEKDVLEHLFKYSDYPKLTFYKEGDPKPNSNEPKRTYVLEYDDSSQVFFREVKEETSAIGKKFFVSNLLETFPGVHFNFLCRSLDLDCLGKARHAMTRRRRQSAVLHKTVYNTIQKLATLNVGLRTNFKERNRSVLNFSRRLKPTLEAEPNLSNLYNAYRVIRDQGLKQSTPFFQKILKPKILAELIRLLTTNAPIQEIQRFIDQYEIFILWLDQPKYSFEAELFSDMAAIAYNLNQDDVLSYLCSKGAPLESLFREHTAVSRFASNELYASKERMVGKCEEAQFLALKRAKNANGNANSNSNRSNRNNTRRRFNRSNSTESRTNLEDPFAA